MKVFISRTRRVVCEAMINLPISAGAAWGQLRDVRASGTHDPFHSSIRIEGNVPRAGAKLEIEHQYILWRTTRIGRILRWNERTGFAFSDLCRSDPQRAFPHIFTLELQPIDSASCRLRIRVGGRWTAPLPKWIGRIWLWWVFSQLVRNTTNYLLRFAIAVRTTSGR